MHVKTRHVLAVAMLATALCADQAIGAPTHQQARPQGTAPATSLFDRISLGFRAVVAAPRLHVDCRQVAGSAVSQFSPPTTPTAIVRVAQTSPFQFRLPPPLV